MKLSSLEHRKRITPGRTFYAPVFPGLSIGYRRNKTGGVWLARVIRGREQCVQKIAATDDDVVANGDDILNYKQAIARAVAIHNEAKTEISSSLDTVADAVEYYFTWYKNNRKSAARTRYIIERHILPRIGFVKLSQLTTSQVRNFLHEVAAAPKINRGIVVIDDSDDAPRKRKVTANRVLTYLKAALNHCYRDGLISTNIVWSRVKPFRDVERAKVAFFSEDELKQFLDAVDGDFGKLCRGALYTGARFGELAKLQVADYNDGSVHLTDTKNGKDRHVPVSETGQQFFDDLCSDKKNDDYVFTFNGERWKRGQQCRRMRTACEDAGVSQLRFHDLRHTYASRLAMNNVPLLTIATLLGHSDTRVTAKHYAHLSPSYLADTVRSSLPEY